MIDPTPITREGAARAARDELDKSIYHRNGDPLPVRLVRSIGHFLDHLFNSAFDHAPGGGFGALILVGVVVLVAGLVIWRVGLPARSNAAAGVFTEGPATSAEDHRRRSIKAAGERDWHTAVLERTRAVARELEERGVLDPRPGRTATELATDAATRLPIAANALTSAARTFNAVAYGGASADADDLAVIIAADEAVQSNSGQLIAV